MVCQWCLNSSVFSPVTGTFHRVIIELFLKREEMFCGRTAAIYIKTICYHGDIHLSFFEIFLEQNVFVHNQYKAHTFKIYWCLLLSLFEVSRLAGLHQRLYSILHILSYVGACLRSHGAEKASETYCRKRITMFVGTWCSRYYTD